MPQLVGFGNTAFGFDTLSLITGTGADNTAVGWGALRANTDGGANTAVGSGALREVTTGVNNTAVGYSALRHDTADSNTAVGHRALETNTVGFANAAVGRNALTTNDSGNYNTALGDASLQQNTSGSNNNAVGANALFHNTSGANNNAQGFNAAFGNTTGSSNSAVGSGALKSNLGGNNNVAIGANALTASTGSGNIGIGSAAGNALASGNNNIYIGSPGTASESRVTRIGSLQTSTFIAGINGVTVASPVQVVIDTTSGQVGVLSSSLRYKDNVRDLRDQSARLEQLRPVTFNYKGGKTEQYGLIAEEVAQVYPELVVRNAAGQAESVQYHELIPLLLKQNQQQQAEIEALKAQVAELRARSIATR